MRRKWPLLTIAAIALVAVCAAIGRRVTKSPYAPDVAIDATQAPVKGKPFRSAVVELTFRSRSLHEGEETLSDTGHRIEYIDVTGGRRREDYDNSATTLHQFTSSEARTSIFDGRNYYVVTEKEGKRAGRVTEMPPGFDFPIWADSMLEEFVKESARPGTAFGQEDFLGRPCKLYSFSKSYSNGTDTQKYWVWNGITLRSELHQETRDTTDTFEEAVRIEEDVDIDPSLFIPPNDVTFEPVMQTPAQQLGLRKSPPWLRMGPILPAF
jgi:hypothetical protein